MEDLRSKAVGNKFLFPDCGHGWDIIVRVMIPRGHRSAHLPMHDPFPPHACALWHSCLPPEWMAACSLPRCFFCPWDAVYLLLYVGFLHICDWWIPRSSQELFWYWCFSCLRFCQGKWRSRVSVLQLIPPGIHWRKAGGCWCLVSPGSVPSISSEEKWCRETEAGVLLASLISALNTAMRHLSWRNSWADEHHGVAWLGILLQQTSLDLLELSDLYRT